MFIHYPNRYEDIRFARVSLLTQKLKAVILKLLEKRSTIASSNDL